MLANYPFIEKIWSDGSNRPFQSELDPEFLPEDGKSFKAVNRGRRQSLISIHDLQVVVRHFVSSRCRESGPQHNSISAPHSRDQALLRRPQAVSS
jgi:hypothetical protein